MFNVDTRYKIQEKASKNEMCLGRKSKKKTAKIQTYVKS